MALKNWLFTSESVSEGHPDKVADRISDEVVDAALRLNPLAKVAIETLVTEGLCVVAGEVRDAHLSDRDVEAVARRAIADIGYLEGPFSAQVPMELRIHGQSPEIACGVDAAESKEEGAGDQGIMFGFACDETDALMPAPLFYAHRIVEELAAARKAGNRELGPDGKSQVTLEYSDGRPFRADTIVVSHQHAPTLSKVALREFVRSVLEKILPPLWLDARTRILVNPAGTFTLGGPAADTGLTGRKIIVDTYGGAAPHGGGAFSGKDPSKVDRSAAYMARYLAKNVVAAGPARRCLLQLAYAIGVAEPVAVYLNCQGTEVIPEESIAMGLRSLVSLTPRAIRDRLCLDRPMYARTAAYGHFGRNPERGGAFSWERTDLVDELQRLKVDR